MKMYSQINENINFTSSISSTQQYWQTFYKFSASQHVCRMIETNRAMCSTIRFFSPTCLTLCDFLALRQVNLWILKICLWNYSGTLTNTETTCVESLAMIAWISSVLWGLKLSVSTCTRLVCKSAADPNFWKNSSHFYSTSWQNLAMSLHPVGCPKIFFEVTRNGSDCQHWRPVELSVFKFGTHTDKYMVYVSWICRNDPSWICRVIRTQIGSKITICISKSPVGMHHAMTGDTTPAPDGTKTLAEPIVTKSIAAYMRPSAAMHICINRHLHRWKEFHWCVEFTGQWWHSACQKFRV